MGFLDNFKAAMQRGAEAANANIERQRAEKAAAAGTARAAPAHCNTISTDSKTVTFLLIRPFIIFPP